MGKRQEKKEHYQKLIIGSAKEMFNKHGFEDTTMGKIAENAGIGLGTAYNYYKSKEELYLYSMFDMMNNSDKLDNIDLENYEYKSEVSEIICQLVLKELKFVKLIHKNIWKSLIPAFSNTMKSNNIIVKQLMTADMKLIEKITTTLIDLQNKGKIRTDYQLEMATESIFGTLILQMFTYIYTDSMDFGDFTKKIVKGIEFNLRGT